MANKLLKKVGKKTATTGSKSTPKVAATVTPDISNAVDQVIASKAEIARLEAELKQSEQKIIDHVVPQYEQHGREGSFTKSLTVEGNSGNLTFTRSDRFSVPQDEEAQGQLQEVCGDLYDSFFETQSTVSVKPDVLNNEAVINKMVAACEKAGLDVGDLFENAEKLVAKKGLDQAQFQLDEEKHQLFKTFVRQNKPGLK
jgi:hypothetical protein